MPITVCFDRGGWSPALFADILDAGFSSLNCDGAQLSGTDGSGTALIGDGMGDGMKVGADVLLDGGFTAPWRGSPYCRSSSWRSIGSPGTTTR